jgi:hypothetical protein
MWILYPFIILAAMLAALTLVLIHRKNVDKIILSNLKRKKVEYEGTKHLFFCFVDHFEPLWHGASKDVGIERVKTWLENYPKVVQRYRDGGERVPQHTFFYPQEEYIPECIDMLRELRSGGYGDVEIHLHHDRDTSEGFREKILSFKQTLHERHGLLHKDPVTGRIEYGFIHGNWALDDSGVDGRWCGVRDEITILKETGCYADFTYPSAPHPTQPPVINRIYYAKDDPDKPKSHHRGDDVCYKKKPEGDLLLITGPVALNWSRRTKGVFPSIENGDISYHRPPTAARIDLWTRIGIVVEGWPRWIFVKVHSHGAQPENARILLGDGIVPLYENLLSRYNDGNRYVLHFVTARELYHCIKTLESGDQENIRLIENFEANL